MSSIVDYFGDLIIQEASVMFSRNTFNRLKCKIIDSQTDEILNSHLVTNCIEFYLPICRAISGFFVELWEQNEKIGRFGFMPEDIIADNNINYEKPQKQTTSVRFNHILIKKQIDQCCLYFKVYTESFRTSDENFIENYHIRVAGEYYQKLIQSTLRKMKIAQEHKFDKNRISMQKLEKKFGNFSSSKSNQNRFSRVFSRTMAINFRMGAEPIQEDKKSVLPWRKKVVEKENIHEQQKKTQKTGVSFSKIYDKISKIKANGNGNLNSTLYAANFWQNTIKDQLIFSSKLPEHCVATSGFIIRKKNKANPLQKKEGKTPKQKNRAAEKKKEILISLQESQQFRDLKSLKN